MAPVMLYHPNPVDSGGAVMSLGFAKLVKNDSIDFSMISTMVGIDARILVAKCANHKINRIQLVRCFIPAVMDGRPIIWMLGKSS